MDRINFSKNKDPFGWLSNMSPYPIKLGDVEYRTSEALFQALRFTDEKIKEAIRAEKSPMSAKMVMINNEKSLAIEKYSKQDIMNMKMCLKLKIDQHPHLKEELINTGDLIICEDVTSRGDKGSNLFWGAMLKDGEWVGENMLGNLWMELRKTIKNG